jgi:hypothetical protein
VGEGRYWLDREWQTADYQIDYLKASRGLLLNVMSFFRNYLVEIPHSVSVRRASHQIAAKQIHRENAWSALTIQLEERITASIKVAHESASQAITKLFRKVS